MFSNVCERSWEGVAEVVVGVKNVHAPNNNETTTHDSAARQSPRTHKSRLRFAPRAASNAVMRFSNAYGTRSLITSARAAAINFFWNSSKFIQNFRRGLLVSGYIYKYLSLAIFARIFLISPRARNARTFTSGTDQPVISAISFTERSSISKSVITSRACGESFSNTR